MKPQTILRQAVRPDGTGAAVYSTCGRYRLSLTRDWGPGRAAVFVMLNPSTASEATDDPTIARCTGFARALGAGGMEVVNLFAFRATHPRDLRRAEDPVGPDNDAAILSAAARAGWLICAWGIHGTLHGRGTEVAALLRAAGHRPQVLGLTKDGHPRHPLYLRRDVQPVDWIAT
ncbi:MAG: DUF1643 domain-containing protein [Limimaricola sp.]|uniref:DUF1643 domain-containing protein n=1 Tax=Limimaricola sp. TaxID=2211665 RepID=UPI001DFB3C59|nr:DUF1643 domain-containing protein [Limimaricola sp.]MBI1416966.1 DUF1643 domain-containing protein [Limimaricola sp.]